MLKEEIVKIENGYLAHLQQPNGLIVAVFIKTQNWEDASDIFSDLRTKVEKTSTRKSILEFISSAHADDDCAQCDLKLRRPDENISNMAKIHDEVAKEQASPIQHLSGCVTKALKGVWTGSGGAVVGGVKEVGKFIISPVESGKRYWESASKLWDVTKNFFSDFENESRKLYSSFDSLDPLVKTELACEILGTVGGGILLSYLTAGVMASAAGRTVLLKIKSAIESALKSDKFASVRKSLAFRKTHMIEAENNLDRDLFDIKRGTAKEAVLKNEKVLENLEGIIIKPASSMKRPGLDDTEIRKLYRQVADNPVAATSMADNYSKLTPGMGYCFGRATAAHIKAISNGLDKNSVRKVWALGELKTGSTNWRYHVTTIVRDVKGKWHAIDPIMGKPMPIEQWYKEMKVFDSTGNMRIYDTPTQRFGPGSPQKYTPSTLKSDSYEGYFNDLMKSFRDEASALAEQRKAVSVGISH